MKKFHIPIVLILVLIAGAAYVFYPTLADYSHLSGAADKVEKYYCPMHPDYVSDRPGDCPICHMRLVPLQKNADDSAKKGDACLMHECPMLKKGEKCPMLLFPKGQGASQCPYCSQHLAEEHPADTAVVGPSTVKMDVAGQNRIGVRIEPVSKRSLKKEILLQARVAYDPELYQAQLDYLQKTKRYQRAANIIDPYSLESADRARLELTSLGLSSDMIEEIKTWKRPDARLIGADAKGELWVYAHFYEEDSAYVKPGSVLEFKDPSSGRTLTAAVRYVDQLIQSSSRTLRARALIQNPEGTLKPDMYLQARVYTDLGEHLSVPHEAILYAGTEPYVFVQKSPDIFEARDIQVGRRAGEYCEVISGLKEGEEVITSGNFLVDSESRIQSALSGSARSGEHRHD